MIYDSLKNWSIYFKNPVFNEIILDLGKLTLNTPDGTYERSKNYYFKVLTYRTHTDASIIESHRREVDIQILLDGTEKINIYSFDEVLKLGDYDEKLDCQFYEKVLNPSAEIILKSGNFAVFFPSDIHQPQLSVRNDTEVLKKIVFKVNEELFT